MCLNAGLIGEAIRLVWRNLGLYQFLTQDAFPGLIKSAFKHLRCQLYMHMKFVIILKKQSSNFMFFGGVESSLFFFFFFLLSFFRPALNYGSALKCR